ncbi:MAG: YicC family protein [Syntrophorhabdaceae bacterium]|nr:YicC family protein [Syntrophorhabdaceae bacterium]
MIKSMTGFSKVEMETEQGRLYGEARSLNNRYLDIGLKLPKVDYSVEQKLRELAKGYLKRGKIDIVIKWDKSAGELGNLKINMAAVKTYLNMLNTLKKEFKLKGEPTVKNLLEFKDIFVYEENNGIAEGHLVRLFKKLMKELDSDRKREGKIILKDLRERLKKVNDHLKEIEERWPKVIKEHETKLKERLKEVTGEVNLDERRVLQEVAIYMERLDITEEVVRLKGHIKNFKESLNSSDSVGRKLDFIIQEFVRETNTIGSKSNDLYINERVVQIKVEVEKIREQVQNVE